MKYQIEPRNFETLHEQHLAVGYYKGKAIVKDESGRLYFVRCEENELPIGTLADAELLEPMELLEKTERLEILRIYGNGNN